MDIAVTPSIVLSSATYADRDVLLQWKNEHRHYFFTQRVISVLEHYAWFDTYLNRINDFMFVVVYKDIKIGCMGVRLLEHTWDIYNVILGDKRYARQGIMRQAFLKMVAFAYEKFPRSIELTVLKTNPAVDWYKKSGFIEILAQDNYLRLVLPQSSDADVTSILIQCDGAQSPPQGESP